MFAEVRFKNTGYCKVYFDGNSVVIDNGVNRFYRQVRENNLYWLLIAIGEFAGLFRDKIEDVVVVEDD